MAITSERVREIFKGLERGDGAAFFEHVADKVDWIVEGTHPLAGHYLSKQAFIAGTFAKLAKVLPEGAERYVENVLVSGDWAVVVLHSLATAKNGLRFDNRYWWVCLFAAGATTCPTGRIEGLGGQLVLCPTNLKKWHYETPPLAFGLLRPVACRSDQRPGGRESDGPDVAADHPVRPPQFPPAVKQRPGDEWRCDGGDPCRPGRPAHGLPGDGIFP